MPIPLISEIVPKNNGTFPLLEDIYIKGSYRIVNDLNERNSITTLRRKNGMKVFSISDKKEYQLLLGTHDNDINNNSNWIDVVDTGGSVDSPIQFFNVNDTSNGVVFTKGDILCWKQNIASDIWVIDYSQHIIDDNIDDLIELNTAYNWKGNNITPYKPPKNDVGNSLLTVTFFFENKGFALIKIINNGFAQTIQFV